ncbi:MAG: hypothetical protein AAFX03_12770 [Pseudomonadota bacterium]
MRNISANVLSLSAMALSSLTTYLTFFDARYTLTTAVASLEMSLQRGGFSDGEEKSVYFRPYMSAQIILSNRGTRSLVVTDAQLVRAAGAEGCELTDTVMESRLSPMIIDPGAVTPLTLEFALPETQQEVPIDAAFDLPSDEAYWCLRWTVFDPQGQRSEPAVPVASITTTYAPPPEEDDYPEAELDVDYPKGPATLARRGLY